jgi:hypothetical protein
MAVLKFYYLADQKDNQKISIFVATKWKGKPIETEEEKPKWWPINKLPFYNMWEDDTHWLPGVLSGLQLRGTFIFDKNWKIESFKINTIKNKQNH